MAVDYLRLVAERWTPAAERWLSVAHQSPPSVRLYALTTLAVILVWPLVATGGDINATFGIIALIAVVRGSAHGWAFAVVTAAGVAVFGVRADGMTRATMIAYGIVALVLLFVPTTLRWVRPRTQRFEVL
jgi:branched-subunit amino acid ABC-type transport system permease component